MNSKLKTLAGGLTGISFGLLTGVAPAQAAVFTMGQVDISSQSLGNAYYTNNALDFTAGVGGPGIADPTPGIAGEVTVTGQGDFSGLTGTAQIFDLFSPTVIEANVPNPVPDTLLLEFQEGTQYFFTNFVRLGSDTGVQTFEFEGYFLNDGDQTFDTFSFVTGQAPVAISDTTTVGSLGEIASDTTVRGNTSYSGTFLVDDEPNQIPEPSSTAGLVATILGASVWLNRKKVSRKLQ